MKKIKFDKRIKNTPNKIWLIISKIDELKGQWIAGAKLSPQALGRLKKSVLVTSTGSSTRIEGAKLSDEDIEKMIRSISIQKFEDRDSQEVKSYYEILDNIFNSWKIIKFNKSSIKHFHQEILKYVDKDIKHRGEYKKNENKVHMVDDLGNSIGILFGTTPAYLTPKEMQELVEWTKNALSEKQYHPLLIIANFIIEFLKIHPFLDGNGRLSRILSNVLFLQSGYLYMPYVSHEKIIEDNKPDYYMALRKSQKTFDTNNENIVPWLEFFLNVILQQSKQAVDLLSHENIEKLLSAKQLLVWQYFAQIKEATPNEIASNVDIARPTVNQALNKLLRLKKIERIGLGRGTRYKIIK